MRLTPNTDSITAGGILPLHAIPLPACPILLELGGALRERLCKPNPLGPYSDGKRGAAPGKAGNEEEARSFRFREGEVRVTTARRDVTKCRYCARLAFQLKFLHLYDVVSLTPPLASSLAAPLFSFSK